MAALDFDSETYPDFDPVTVTVIALPASAATNAYTEDVAPAISTPRRNHRYDSHERGESAVTSLATAMTSRASSRPFAVAVGVNPTTAPMERSCILVGRISDPA